MSDYREEFERAFPNAFENLNIEQYALMKQGYLAGRKAQPVDARIKSLTADDKGIELNLEGGACTALAAAFFEQFKDAGAENFLELSFFHPDSGPFTVTVQKVRGETPGAKANRLERELAQVKAEG